MKAGQKLWTREELILAINLYSRIPNGVMHKGNPEVIALSKIIDRTPDAISLKLGNLKRLDPIQRARGQYGNKNGGRLEEAIWDEFYGNIEDLAFESELIRAKRESRNIEDILTSEPELDTILPKEGLERKQLVKVRVNQSFFRQMVMAAYNSTCCVTGIKTPELLVAGHIRRWSEDESNRMNPHNGIAINALHDRAFEHGLITITPDYIVQVSSKLKGQGSKKRLEELFFQYHDTPMVKPLKFYPDPDFLRYHNEVIFQR